MGSPSLLTWVGGTQWWAQLSIYSCRWVRKQVLKPFGHDFEKCVSWSAFLTLIYFNVSWCLSQSVSQSVSSVVSNSLWPHGLQHARLPCPSPTPELVQTHVHWVSDAIQPSHPLSSPSPPAFNLSQHQGLFQWVSFLHQVAKVLELQLQYQSFQWISRIDFL